MNQGELSQVVLFLIDQTSKIAKQHSQREFDALGMDITVDQWVLLKILQEKPDISQQALASAAHRDPASITRTLVLLEQKKLVTRSVVPDDRRQYTLRLSRQGVSFIEKHMPLIEKLRAIGLQGFTRKDVEQFKSLLLRMQKNYS